LLYEHLREYLISLSDPVEVQGPEDASDRVEEGEDASDRRSSSKKSESRRFFLCFSLGEFKKPSGATVNKTVSVDCRVEVDARG